MAGILYGFVSLKDVFGRRVSQVGTRVINQAIDQTLAEHNRQFFAFTGLFVRNVTDIQLTYRTGTARRLQPLDEYGRARPRKGGAAYSVGFPLYSAGDAFGQTYMARVKATVEEVNNDLSDMLMADIRWMRDHILAALYDNAGYTFVDEEYGNIAVKGLANGDGTNYQILRGTDMPADDTHYGAQAAAIADASNPFPAIFADLSEHPENGGPYVAFIPTGLKASVQGLATFHQSPDPNISTPTLTQLVGTLGLTVPGTVIGYEESGFWIVEWPNLPANYIVALAAGGQPPLGMRQHPEAELQGFKRVADRDDHPYYESQYHRHAGFGGWNRVAAYVMRIGNAAYAIPTNYTQPMA